MQGSSRKVAIDLVLVAGLVIMANRVDNITITNGEVKAGSRMHLIWHWYRMRKRAFRNIVRCDFRDFK
jgi:hypothetical protein